MAFLDSSVELCVLSFVWTFTLSLLLLVSFVKETDIPIMHRYCVLSSANLSLLLNLVRLMVTFTEVIVTFPLGTPPPPRRNEVIRGRRKGGQFEKRPIYRRLTVRVKFHSPCCLGGGLASRHFPRCVLATQKCLSLALKSRPRCIFHGGSVISCWCLATTSWPKFPRWLCEVPVLKCTSTGTEWPHLPGEGCTGIAQKFTDQKNPLVQCRPL